MVDTTTLLLIQNDLDGLAAVFLGAGALADDLDGVDEVGEDGVVDGRQSAGTGALLLQGGAAVDGALGAGEDTALGHEEDVAVGELLLELTGQAARENPIHVSFRAIIFFFVFIRCFQIRDCFANRSGSIGG